MFILATLFFAVAVFSKVWFSREAVRVLPVEVYSADGLFCYVESVFLPAIYKGRFVVAVVRFCDYSQLVCDVTSRLVGIFLI